MKQTTPSLKTLHKLLLKQYGRAAPPKTVDPLGLIVHESIAYLVPDEKRDAAFDLFMNEVGLDAGSIIAAPAGTLLRITTAGGVHPELRAARLREIAQIVINEFQGDLHVALKLPLRQARKAFQKFPSIGPPGADKILLFTRSHPVLALDSNGLRVLLRIGYGEERKSYSASYASVQNELAEQVPQDCDFLISLYQLLRQHGKTLCRTNRPACDVCPVASTCAYFQNLGQHRQR